MTHEPTSIADCDVAIADLVESSKGWLDEAPSDMVALLERLNDALMANTADWIAAAGIAKQVAPDQPVAGEEWASIAVVARYIRLLGASIADIAVGRKPQFAGKPHPVTGGHTAIPVFPFDAIDKVALSGFSAEVLLTSGVAAIQAVEGQATAWFGGGVPAVSLVLGAGNQASIPLTDALDKLFIARRPVMVKLSPVNDYLGPVFTTICAELIERGVLRIVYGGADVGTYLVRHDGLTEIHVTGSDETFNAIVFGAGEDGARRRAAADPLVTKPVSSELGNVSPVIVVPGPWNAKDMAFHTQNIASMLTQNAGFNCVALRALITATSWDQRGELLEGVGNVLAETAERFPYYPGARERYDAFVAAYPAATRFGDDADGAVPWTMIPGLGAETESELAFEREAFNGVFGEVGLDSTGTVDFIRKAVQFANERLWGNLGCSLIVHPKTLDDPEVQRAVDQAIADLRYGTIAVNHWTGIGFMLGSTPWGAYPGNLIEEIQSGTGFVHNALMLDEADIHKTVVRGPFRMPVKPTWFATNKTGHRSSEMFARLQAKPSWGKLPGLITTAMRG
jgi:Aldehyde dehydrogenase family